VHWHQLVGWILLVWCGAAVLLTPLVALFIRGGKRAQLISERSEWARLRRRRKEALARRRTGTAG
jgi:hypothetical protein